MLPLFVRVPWLHVKAMTLWFVVIYKGDPPTEQVKRHETIHFWQYNELLVLGFIAIYVRDFAVGYWICRDFWKAYRAIRLEQEAYANDGDVHYAETRTAFAWRQYPPPEKLL